MALVRQLENEAAPYVRLGVSRGEAVEVVLYVDKDGNVRPWQVKAKSGKGTPT